MVLTVLGWIEAHGFQSAPIFGLTLGRSIFPFSNSHSKVWVEVVRIEVYLVKQLTTYISLEFLAFYLCFASCISSCY